MATSENPPIKTEGRRIATSPIESSLKVIEERITLTRGIKQSMIKLCNEITSAAIQLKDKQKNIETLLDIINKELAINREELDQFGSKESSLMVDLLSIKNSIENKMSYLWDDLIKIEDTFNVEIKTTKTMVYNECKQIANIHDATQIGGGGTHAVLKGTNTSKSIENTIPIVFHDEASSFLMSQGSGNYPSLRAPSVGGESTSSVLGKRNTLEEGEVKGTLIVRLERVHTFQRDKGVEYHLIVGKQHKSPKVIPYTVTFNNVNSNEIIQFKANSNTLKHIVVSQQLMDYKEHNLSLHPTMMAKCQFIPV